jgi:hypothetical protein
LRVSRKSLRKTLKTIRQNILKKLFLRSSLQVNFILTLENEKKEEQARKSMISRKPWANTKALYLALPKKRREHLLRVVGPNDHFPKAMLLRKVSKE